jgi:hypothetical protein
MIRLRRPGSAELAGSSATSMTFRDERDIHHLGVFEFEPRQALKPLPRHWPIGQSTSCLTTKETSDNQLLESMRLQQRSTHDLWPTSSAFRDLVSSQPILNSEVPGPPRELGRTRLERVAMKGT